MRTEDIPAVPEDGLPVTPTEQLTADFYAWEQRGRGWQVWPYPVVLEPPFRPFFGHLIDQPPARDDARKPTVLSSIVDRIKGAFSGRPAHSDWINTVPDEALEEPEPEVALGTTELVEIRITLPQHAKVTPTVTEQFLLSLAYCSNPLSFEVVGLPQATLVQIACHESDAGQVRKQLRAHFPDSSLGETRDFLKKRWRTNLHRLIVDFGLAHEFMRPLRAFPSFEVDPLIGVTGALEDVADGECALLQVLLEPAREPWTESILRSVTDWEGKPFFADAPEMVPLAREKVDRPLFAAVVRVAAQSPLPDRVQELVRALGAALAPLGSPGSNELIPLINRGYDYDLHEEDLLLRCSHRSGMILNSAELVSLVHPPSVAVRAEKLAREARKTKAAPAVAQGHALVLGENIHQGKMTQVSVTPEQRFRHMHIVGATGTGKSTLMVRLITQDIAQGNGVGVIDPHGDLVDEVLCRIPDKRWDDVVLFDPADAEFPIGFNVLSAASELEKTLLISDLGAIFRRFATSWGDQMTSVLGNAIMALVESTQGGTLLDLRRFLIEPAFRTTVLKTVTDPQVRYFWEKEFSLLKGTPQASILTRLDSFLRPKLVRSIVAQKESRIRFDEILNTGKIFLAKLAHGLIGEENAHLLGAFLVSKLHQVVMARQELAAASRRPFFLYVDEFQHFITPSLASLLSGARKYRLGLILAHQDLRQLWNRDTDVASAVIANPSIRVCFRLGDFDAQKLKSGFASFDPQDLQNLGVGEAIARIERADYDFNLKTLPVQAVDESVANQTRGRLIVLSRDRYATRVEAVEKAYAAEVAAPEVAPVPEASQRTVAAAPVPPAPQKTPIARPAASSIATQPAPRKEAPKSKKAAAQQATDSEPSEVPIPEPPASGRGGAHHKYLQQLIKRFAEDKGYRVTIEKPILQGAGSVDVALERDGTSIACEISVNSTPEQELKNVQKCLAAGFDEVAVVSSEKKTIAKISALVSQELGNLEAAKVHFFLPEACLAFLEEKAAAAAGKEQTVRGYKVKVRYQRVGETEKTARSQAIAQTIAGALKRLKRGD